MWGRKRLNTARITTLVGRDTEVAGDIKFVGGLHVEGRVQGNVVAAGEERAVVVVSENGSIQGQVQAPVILISGAVEGDVHASVQLELASSARIKGNVHYRLLQMDKGAEINGQLLHRKEGESAANFEAAVEESDEVLSEAAEAVYPRADY